MGFGAEPRRVRRGMVVVVVAVLWAVPSVAPAQLPPLTAAPLTHEVTVTVDLAGDLGPLNRDLVGFNWRTGGEVIGPIQPSIVRLWSVDFSRITAAPGVYDWSQPDAEVDAVRAMGAVPLVVLVGRPPWAPAAGSAGYEDAVRAAVQRYGVERVATGDEPAWFESGNEPEFPPTSHGQLLTDVPLDAAAQARAVARVEAASGVAQRWGGPGALFPDPVAVEAFTLGAAFGGRPPDYLSWHAYTNQPFLGPDGSEFDDPAGRLAYSLLRGTNPLASPLLIGAGVELMQLLAELTVAPDGQPPEVVLTEWNLSSGGLDHRHDTHEGAAHALAGLVELQTAGADAATSFASVDRHCPQVAGPDPRCGDWGIATLDGERKPSWWAFDWWHRLGAGRVVPIAGSSPLEGLWVLATRSDDGVARVLLASFSALLPTARTIRIAGVTPSAPGAATVRRLDDPSGDEPVAEPVGDDLVVALPANSAALVEIPLGSPVGRVG